jgi:hypothetical protein
MPVSLQTQTRLAGAATILGAAGIAIGTASLKGLALAVGGAALCAIGIVALLYLRSSGTLSGRAGHQLVQPAASSLGNSSSAPLPQTPQLSPILIPAAVNSVVATNAQLLEAVAKSSTALCGADSQLRNNEDFMLAAGKKNFLAFGHIGDKLKDSKEFMLKAIAIHFTAASDASEQLRNDEDFMLKAIKQNSATVLYLGTQLKGNKDFWLRAIEQSPDAAGYLKDPLKSDAAFMEAVAKLTSRPAK